MKRTLAATAVVLAVAGCSGASTAHNAPTSHSPSSPAPSSTAQPRSLRASCPLMEAAIPGNPIVSEARWASAVNQLTAIAAAGDQETKNAVALLHRAAERMASDPARGTPYLNAEDKLLTALSDVRHRCRDVGSSAFQ